MERKGESVRGEGESARRRSVRSWQKSRRIGLKNSPHAMLCSEVPEKLSTAAANKFRHLRRANPSGEEAYTTRLGQFGHGLAIVKLTLARRCAL